jgi:hypothetical protein
MISCETETMLVSPSDKASWMAVFQGWTPSFLSPAMVEAGPNLDDCAGPTGLLCSEHPKKMSVINAAMSWSFFIVIHPLNLELVFSRTRRSNSHARSHPDQERLKSSRGQEIPRILAVLNL